MAKITTLKVPQSKVRELAVLCDALDIKIISQYATESLFGDVEVSCIVKMDDNEIPATLKEEKLKEKFGKYIKAEEV